MRSRCPIAHRSAFFRGVGMVRGCRQVAKRPLRIEAKLLSVLFIMSTVAWLAPATAAAARAVRVVPSQAFPTIESAVHAANPGDEIKVLPGVYREQVSIDKSVTITGSGADVTTIAAPQKLLPGADGKASIVEIGGGASVAISRIGVSGPATGTCDKGALEAGIHVVDSAHLDLRYARVTHIRNSPTVACLRSGVGVLVGIINDPASGTAVIRDSEISDYATKGILILSAGPATISHNIITGPAQLSADGIDALFSASSISYNLIKGNVCPAGCGPDPVNDFQKFAILVGGVPGAVVSHNLLVGNQVGIYGQGDGIAIDHNVLSNNQLFGMELQDGEFEPRNDLIFGGVSGVVAMALSANTHAQLNREKIVGTSGPAVQTFQCCGFTATAEGPG